MVDVRMGVANEVAQTTATTRTFEPWTGFGNPKGGICFGSNAQALGTDTVQNKLSIGVFDSDLNQAVLAHKSRDNQTTTSCQRSGANDRCFHHINNAGTAVVGEGKADSLSTDGVVVDYTDAYPVAAQQFIAMFGGADMRCRAGIIEMDQALNATKDIGSLPFAPTAIVAIGSKYNMSGVAAGRPTSPATQNDARMFVGFAAKHTSSIVQGSYNWMDVHGQGTGTKEVYGLPTATYLLAPIIDSGGGAATDGAFKVTEFGSDYVRIKKEVDDIDHWMIYLVLGGAEFYMVQQDAPSTNSTQTVPASGSMPFDPLGALTISCAENGALETIHGPANTASTVGFGAFGWQSGQEGSVAAVSQASASPSNCNCVADSVGIYTPNGGLTDYVDAEVNDGTGSWGSGEFTVNFVNTIAGRAVWYLAMEKGGVAVALSAASGEGSGATPTVAEGTLTTALSAATGAAEGADMGWSSSLTVGTSPATGTAEGAALAWGSTLAVALAAASGVGSGASPSAAMGALSVALGQASGVGTALALLTTEFGLYELIARECRMKWLSVAAAEFPGITTKFDNQPFTLPDEGTGYARHHVIYDSADVMSSDATGTLIMVRGRLEVELVGAFRRGTSVQENQFIRDGFTDVDSGRVRFTTPREVQYERSGGRTQMVVECPFWIDDIDLVPPRLVLPASAGGGFDDVSNRIRERLVALAASQSVSIKLPNMPFVRPDNTQWLSLLGVFESGAVQSMAGSPTDMRALDGFFRVQVRGPLHSGEQRILELVDAIDQAFRGLVDLGTEFAPILPGVGLRSGQEWVRTVSGGWHSDTRA